MIEFLSVAALLFAFISIALIVLSGVAILLSMFIDSLQDKFGYNVAFWTCAVIFIAFISALLSGLILLGEGSVAQ